MTPENDVFGILKNSPSGVSKIPSLKSFRKGGKLPKKSQNSKVKKALFQLTKRGAKKKKLYINHANSSPSAGKTASFSGVSGDERKEMLSVSSPRSPIVGRDAPAAQDGLADTPGADDSPDGNQLTGKRDSKYVFGILDSDNNLEILRYKLITGGKEDSSAGRSVGEEEKQQPMLRRGKAQRVTKVPGISTRPSASPEQQVSPLVSRKEMIPEGLISRSLQLRAGPDLNLGSLLLPRYNEQLDYEDFDSQSIITHRNAISMLPNEEQQQQQQREQQQQRQEEFISYDSPNNLVGGQNLGFDRQELGLAERMRDIYQELMYGGIGILNITTKKAKEEKESSKEKMKDRHGFHDFTYPMDIPTGPPPEITLDNFPYSYGSPPLHEMSFLHDDDQTWVFDDDTQFQPPDKAPPLWEGKPGLTSGPPAAAGGQPPPPTQLYDVPKASEKDLWWEIMGGAKGGVIGKRPKAFPLSLLDQNPRGLIGGMSAAYLQKQREQWTAQDFDMAGLPRHRAKELLPMDMDKAKLNQSLPLKAKKKKGQQQRPHKIKKQEHKKRQKPQTQKKPQVQKEQQKKSPKQQPQQQKQQPQQQKHQPQQQGKLQQRLSHYQEDGHKSYPLYGMSAGYDYAYQSHDKADAASEEASEKSANKNLDVRPTRKKVHQERDGERTMMREREVRARSVRKDEIKEEKANAEKTGTTSTTQDDGGRRGGENRELLSTCHGDLEAGANRFQQGRRRRRPDSDGYE